MSGISENTGKLRAIAASVRNGFELGDTAETLEWCADEIDRLSAENAELRASYERVEKHAQSLAQENSKLKENEVRLRSYYRDLIVEDNQRQLRGRAT